MVVAAIDGHEPDIKKASAKSKKLLAPEIVSQIVLGNNYFTQTHPHEYFETFSFEQKPYITLVTCSDSRVPLNALMPDTSNKVFSIQNIGNQIFIYRRFRGLWGVPPENTPAAFSGPF